MSLALLSLEADIRVQVLGNPNNSEAIESATKKLNKSNLYQITPFYSASLLPLEESLLFILVAEIRPNDDYKENAAQIRMHVKSLQQLQDEKQKPRLILVWISEEDEIEDIDTEYLLVENACLKAQPLADKTLKLKSTSELVDNLHVAIRDVLEIVDQERRERYESELVTLLEAQSQSNTPKRFDERIQTLKHVLEVWGQREEVIEQGIDEQITRIGKNLGETEAEAVASKSRKRIPAVGLKLYDATHYFRDRETERQKLSRFLADDDTKIVSVIGFGGIGKSALVSKVLSDIELHGKWTHKGPAPTIDGIVYMSSQTNKISLERVFFDFGDILNVIDNENSKQDLLAMWNSTKATIPDKVASLLRRFESYRVIVLWDNFETYLGDDNQIADADLNVFFDSILRATTGLRFVVTTRRPINFPEDLQVFDKQISVREGLPLPDAVQMLKDLDSNGKSGLSSLSGNLLERAAKRVDGVPRALEIINSILAKSPLLRLETLLEEDRIFEHQDFVTKLVEANYGYLDNHSRKVLEAVAVFDVPIKPDAIDFLLQPFVKGIDTPTVIQSLFDVALLNIDRAAGTVSLHPVDKKFIYQRIPKNGEYSIQMLEARAAEFYRVMRPRDQNWRSIDDLEYPLIEFEHLIKANLCEEALALLDEIDYDHLNAWAFFDRVKKMRLSLNECFESSDLIHENLAELTRVAAPYVTHQEAVGYLDAAIAHAETNKDSAALIRYLSYLADRYYDDVKNTAKAIALSETALAVSDTIEDKRVHGRLLGILGGSHYREGRTELAIQFRQKRIEMLEATDLDRDLGTAYNDLAYVYKGMHRQQEALPLYQKSVDLGIKRGDRHLSSRYSNIGTVYSDLGEIRKAIEQFQKALELDYKNKNLRGLGIRFGRLAHNYRKLGDYNRGIEFREKAVAAETETGNLRLEALERLSLAADYARFGELQKATTHFNIANSSKGFTKAENHQRFFDVVIKYYFYTKDFASLVSFAEQNESKVKSGQEFPLDVFGIGLIMLGRPEEAKGVLDRAIEHADSKLELTPSLYAAKYSKGITHLALSLLDERNKKKNTQSGLNALSAGFDNCSAIGVREEAMRILNVLPLEDSVPTDVRQTLDINPDGGK